MDNLNSELDGKYLGTISKDFVVVSDTLKEAAYQLKARKISEYPIFIFSKEPIEIGALLIGKTEVAIEWDINFSFLENFAQNKIITGEGIELFKQNYKNPEEFACLFVINGEDMQFMFIPYPEE